MSGNPRGKPAGLANRATELRLAVLEAVTPSDVAAVVRAMVAEATRGNVGAARLLLEYTVGKPEPLEAANAVGVKILPRDIIDAV